jgi:hypothetical protein
MPKRPNPLNQNPKKTGDEQQALTFWTVVVLGFWLGADQLLGVCEQKATRTQ